MEIEFTTLRSPARFSCCRCLCYCYPVAFIPGLDCFGLPQGEYFCSTLILRYVGVGCSRLLWQRSSSAGDLALLNHCYYYYCTTVSFAFQLRPLVCDARHWTAEWPARGPGSVGKNIFLPYYHTILLYHTHKLSVKGNGCYHALFVQRSRSCSRFACADQCRPVFRADRWMLLLLSCTVVGVGCTRPAASQLCPAKNHGRPAAYIHFFYYYCARVESVSCCMLTTSTYTTYTTTTCTGLSYYLLLSFYRPGPW